MALKKLFNKITKRRLSVFFILLLSGLSAAWWLSYASYLELHVPVASYHGEIWWDTHLTTLSYADEPGVLYVLRRSGRAYADVQGWHRPEDVTAYFDKWLTERGWLKADIYSGGDPAVPETKFLPFGETGYLEYVKDGDRWGRGARVIVAVRQVKGSPENPSCGLKTSFDISLTTVQPSFAKSFYYALD